MHSKFISFCSDTTSYLIWLVFNTKITLGSPLSLTVLSGLFSGLFGGFFAGVFSNYFESRRRVQERRTDKYYDHRNTLVQIEQELIPSRVDLSRNINSVKEALNYSKNNQVRVILRFYKLKLSTGLGLKLLNVDFINRYSEVYILFESINSDIEYITELVNVIRNDFNENRLNESLLSTYILLVSFLDASLKKADRLSRELLSMCRLAIDEKHEFLLAEFVRTGKQIDYSFSKKDVAMDGKAVDKQEHRSPQGSEESPRFFAPYMDLKRE